MTELQIRQKVVETANQWIGVKKGSAAHKALIETYNTIKPLPRGYRLTTQDHWCAGFVSAVAVQSGESDIFALECSCTRMVAIYKEMGRWEERDDYRPQIGDVVFYRWDDGKDYKTTDQKKNPNHVGIVTEVSGNAFSVTEGNMSINGVSQVGVRLMEVNGRYIRGFGLPNYASKAAADGPWYEAPMQWAKDMGLMDGTRPTDPVTRAELATVCKRLYELME